MRRLAVVLAVALLLPATAAAQDGKPIVGGGSFNTAPLLAPGRYADTVAAGETVYWRVKLAKGQILQVTATVDTSQIQTDFGANDFQPGLANLRYEMRICTPIREELDNEPGAQYDDASVDLEGDREAGTKRGTARSSRVLGFEQILASDFGANKYPAPGEWFVSVSVADDDLYPAEVPAELPLDLEIAVEGAPQPSSADFASKLPGPEAEKPAPDEPDPTDATPTGALGGSAAPGDPAVTIGLIAVLTLLGGVGLGALAGLVLRARPLPGR